VPLKVSIKAYGVEAPVTCEGETIVVNLHGALISTLVGLKLGMVLDIHVHLTGKRAIATVAYVDPAQPLHCGIELAKPQNIWGVSLLPHDWQEDNQDNLDRPTP
jgi:hypothetical protein